MMLRRADWTDEADRVGGHRRGELMDVTDQIERWLRCVEAHPETAEAGRGLRDEVERLRSDDARLREAMVDLRHRAEVAVSLMTAAEASSDGAMRQRLAGKAEGVNLVLSYLREIDPDLVGGDLNG